VTDDRRWLTLAIELAHRCPPSKTAFSVGAVIVDVRGTEISRGFSRETGRRHAEEAALRKLDATGPAAAPGLGGATLYSSLEPCAQRASGARACTDLIIAAGIRRVVIAWREPPIFVPRPGGVAALEAAGVAVVELPDLAGQAAAVNAHLLPRPGEPDSRGEPDPRDTPGKTGGHSPGKEGS
jgi:diaminohydroxyphosphoribosylaminopyrimidine deaminase / 5-amino-6-(5-phosphoribosylamino)uracil reductase